MSQLSDAYSVEVYCRSNNALPKNLTRPLGLVNGYGFGLHVSRYVEFTPYVAVGMDNVSSSQLEKFFKDDEAKKKKLFTDSTGWFGDVGLKVNILPYPFQIFGIVDYSFLFLKGEIYNTVNNSMGARQHKSGLNFGGGIRYCF